MITTFDGLTFREQLAENYKASIPKGTGKNSRGKDWNTERVAQYIKLRFEGISLVGEYKTKRIKILLNCEKHGNYTGWWMNLSLISKKAGNGCMDCSQLSKAKAIRHSSVKKSTKEEHQKAVELYKIYASYCKVADILGRSESAVRRWCDKRQQDLHRQNSKSNPNSNHKDYYYTHPNGKTTAYKSNHKRRALKRGAIFDVFLPEHSEANQQGFVRVDMWDFITPDDYDIWSFDGASKAVKELRKEMKELEQQTGIKYSLEHLVPLSHGGLHSPENLDIRPWKDNLSKGSSRVKEDDALFCKRIFNIK